MVARLCVCPNLLWADASIRRIFSCLWADSDVRPFLCQVFCFGFVEVRQAGGLCFFAVRILLFCRLVCFAVLGKCRVDQESAGILQQLMLWRTTISAAAYVILRDVHRAEDVFQSVVLKAVSGQVQFSSEAALMSWALVSARHESIDILRRQQTEQRWLSERVSELMFSEWQQSAFSGDIRSSALQDCLQQLPERLQQLLQRRYTEGLSCEAIAQECQEAVTAVYKRLSRVHQRLRQCVQRRLEAEGA